MRLAVIPRTASLESPPLWPPLLAARGPGFRSDVHAHHAMHFVLAMRGSLRVRVSGERRWRRSAGVLTRADASHAIDATESEILLVFVDPESDAGSALRATFDAPVRTLGEGERGRLIETSDPMRIMTSEGSLWTSAAVDVLGGARPPARRALHPRVRKLLRLVRTLPVDGDASLEGLAAWVGLSPSRLMHVFTESLGIPLRPYLAWLKLQRAAASISSGATLVGAAQMAGFADAAHMSRAFRQMLGMTPSALRRTL